MQSSHGGTLPRLPAAPWRGALNGVLFVVLFAALVDRLASLPSIARLGMSPLIVGIAAGALYSNVLRVDLPESWNAGIDFSARRLLRMAVAAYGLRVSFQEIAHIGIAGLMMSTLVVATTLGLGIVVGMRVLKLDRDTALLTAAGSAICGAAAVVAVESALRAPAHKSALAVGSVVLFGTLSMFAYPLAYHAGWLPLGSAGLGLFFGGTIHEVAQVVGAASAVDPALVHAATIVKMTRVLLLVPVVLVLSLSLARRQTGDAARSRGRVAVPWFALGFLALVALNSTGVIAQAVSDWANRLDTFALTMAMTALGMQTRVAQVRRAGPRPLLLGLVLQLWLVAGGLGLAWWCERLAA